MELIEKKLIQTEALVAVQKEVTDKLSIDRDRLQKDIKKLDDAFDDQEQYSRRTCLLLHGVKEERGEDVEKKVTEVLNGKLKADLDEKDVCRTHRLGKSTTNGRPRPIIIRFLSYRQRKKAFGVKRDLKNSGMVLTENLTKKRYTLLQKCVSEFGRENVWSYDGRIYYKDVNETKHCFTTMEELINFQGDL